MSSTVIPYPIRDASTGLVDAITLMVQIAVTRSEKAIQKYFTQ